MEPCPICGDMWGCEHNAQQMEMLQGVQRVQNRVKNLSEPSKVPHGEGFKNMYNRFDHIQRRLNSFDHRLKRATGKESS